MIFCILSYIRDIQRVYIKSHGIIKTDGSNVLYKRGNRLMRIADMIGQKIHITRHSRLVLQH